jgi:hypothetical protein
MKKCLIKTLLVVFGNILFVGTIYSWHVTVTNDTNYVIEATCKKVGAVHNKGQIIQPKQTIEVGCGAADCSKGINIVVYELFKGTDNLWDAKDIEISTKWTLKCGNKTVRVAPDDKGSYKIEVK